jgi:hypothetical protein
VLVLERYFVVLVEVACQRRETQGREERVFDRPENGLFASVRAGRIIFTFIVWPSSRRRRQAILVDPFRA